MRYSIFLLIVSFVLTFLSCEGQVDNDNLRKNPINDRIITIQILTINNEPLPLVNIAYSNSKIGTLTDKNGVAKLPFKRDSLIISHVGYYSLKQFPSLSEDTIQYYLISEFRELETVEVFSRSFLKQKQYFSSDTQNDGYIKFGFGSQIGFMVSDFKGIKNGKLYSLKLPILKTKYDSEIRLQIVQFINKINNTKDILFDSIILIKKGIKKIEIDFSELNVYIEGNQILLSVTNLGKPGFKEGEYLKYRGQNVEPFYKLTSRFPQKATYINYLDKEWSLYPVLNSPNGLPSITNLSLTISLLPFK